MTASAMPPSVAALNHLLQERGPRPGVLPRILGISYLAHATAFAAFFALVREGGQREFGAATSFGTVMGVTPLYSPGAAPGPVRPAAPPSIEERPKPMTRPPEPAAPRQVPVDEPPPEPDANDLIREAQRKAERPVAAPPSRNERTRSAPAAAPAAKPGPPEPSGGGTLEAATGPPGSPSGVLGGSPDGGLTSLLFSDRWYAQRVQDIVYANWGNPFPGRLTPDGRFAVVIRFRIVRDGTIQDAAVDESSGNAAWDRAGLRAVENARLPPLPPSYKRAGVSVFFKFDFDPSTGGR